MSHSRIQNVNKMVIVAENARQALVALKNKRLAVKTELDDLHSGKGTSSCWTVQLCELLQVLQGVHTKRRQK